MNALDEIHRHESPFEPELDARIESYSLAARMQLSAGEALDLTQESRHTLALYGVGDAASSGLPADIERSLPAIRKGQFEIGAERIIFGSHLPSRSLGTELGKVLGADLSEHDRMLILGENYRNLLRPISGSIH